jgi:hypothetical protein
VRTPRLAVPIIKQNINTDILLMHYF